MGIKTTSKSGLFLLELVLSILFFSLTSAVCVSLFVNARLTSVKSRDLTAASLQAQTVAECYKAADTDFDRLAAHLNAQQQEGSLYLFYDEDWQPVTEQNLARYTLCISDTSGESSALGSAQITITKGDSELFSLDVKQYRDLL